MPACAHCVLRWEWIGVQGIADSPNVIEYYTNAIDVSIQPSAAPFPLSQIPTTAIDLIAHLPQSVDEYRDAYGSRSATKWIQQTGHKFITGPKWVPLWTGAMPGGYIDTGTGDVPAAPYPTLPPTTMTEESEEELLDLPVVTGQHLLQGLLATQ